MIIDVSELLKPGKDKTLKGRRESKSNLDKSKQNDRINEWT